MFRRALATARMDLDDAAARFERLHGLMEAREAVLIEAFVKHLKQAEETPRERRSYAKRWQQNWRDNVIKRRIAAGILGVLFTVTPAWAVGPVVGPGCTLSWTAVTTYTDATPIAVPVTYNVYVATGVQTAPAIPPVLTGLTTTTANICTGRPAGQATAWVSAVAGGSEGAVSAASPFVLSLQIPGVPTNVIVK